MQDGWGDKEGSVAASRHSSWEDDEEGGGMWNSTGSQGSSSSWGQGSNGGWGQSLAGKKPSNKVRYYWREFWGFVTRSDSINMATSKSHTRSHSCCSLHNPTFLCIQKQQLSVFLLHSSLMDFETLCDILWLKFCVTPLWLVLNVKQNDRSVVQTFFNKVNMQTGS